ncbi:MAG TPA: hypothetical protein VNJ04_06350 [Gemmatimonadaceae bacterium]|nr:hypothetical protein [Gemmatimonadaceae bacterium]
MHVTGEQTRFVTERYWELQGLRSVLVGGAFVAAFGLALLLGGPEPSEFAETLAFAAAMVAILPGMFWLDRYYANVFGQIKPSRSARRAGLFVLPGVLLASMFVERVLELRPRTLFFASMAAFELWIAFRDWPRRPHYIGGAAAAALVSALQFRGPANSTDMQLAGFFVMGAAMVITGMRDHQLLEATFHRNRPGDLQREHADTV